MLLVGIDVHAMRTVFGLTTVEARVTSTFSCTARSGRVMTIFIVRGQCHTSQVLRSSVKRLSDRQMDQLTEYIV
jgi:hypothetical protein